MHKILKRQLKKLQLDCDTVPHSLEEWQLLLKYVDRNYTQSDEDRYILERSLEVSSKEMRQLYDSLKKTSESMLTKERDRFRAIVRSLGEGLCVLDSEGQITYINPKGCELLKCSQEVLLWHPFSEMVAENTHSEFFTKEVLSERTQTTKGECHLSIEEGDPSPIEVHYTITPVKDLNESVAGAVVVFRDVSAEKRLKEKLTEARDKALEASKMKSDFLANMSHEIRTPLNGIVSLAELLLYSELDDEQREDVTTIQSSVHMLKRIIDDILDFSKIESGKLFLDVSTFKIEVLIQKILKHLTPLANEKNIIIHNSLESEIPKTLLGDELRLYQVLCNLVGNAIKFTPQGGEISINITSSETFQDQNLLLFSIQDNGVGVPKNKQEVIFDSFAQADYSTTREFGGTGLGLTICGRLVNMMDGHIWMESEEGAGSTFYFTALLGIPEKSDTTPRSKLKRARGMARHSKVAQSNKEESLRILLAEDNHINQEAISRMLALHGHKVVVAADGFEALSILDTTQQSDRFDLILMDLHMPKIGGIDTAKQIRKNRAYYSEIPIVALTAHAITGVNRECLEAGMNDYISKPIDYDDLFSVVKKLGTSQSKTNALD